MTDSVSKRFLDCYNELDKRGKVKSNRQFCLSLNFTPQSWSQIQKGQRTVPVDLIKKAIIKYKFNPIYIFTGAGEKFITDKKNSHQVKITIDQNEKQRIVHVPVKAKAGYLEQFDDKNKLKDLISYNLPIDYFAEGNLRSFEVDGYSMEPTFQSGDIVICSSVDDPIYWQYNIKTGYVYVIVTRNDIFIKRVQNKLKNENMLVLTSDNNEYPDSYLNAKDIKEVWFVKMKISAFAHSKMNLQEELMEKYNKLNETINNQSITIERLNSTIEKLLQKHRKI